MSSNTLFGILVNARVIDRRVDPALNATPSEVFARLGGISELILTANRLGGHGSMHIGLASASEIKREQLSHETATPVSRKTRVV